VCFSFCINPRSHSFQRKAAIVEEELKMMTLSTLNLLKEEFYVKNVIEY
jgi:hypothetical protein